MINISSPVSSVGLLNEVAGFTIHIKENIPSLVTRASVRPYIVGADLSAASIVCITFIDIYIKRRVLYY